VVTLLLLAQFGFAQGRLTVTREARATQPGEVVLLTIDAPASVQQVTVRAFDRD